MLVQIDTLDTIDGTVVLMSGNAPDGHRVQVAVDRHAAFDIAFAIQADGGPVPCDVAPWQLMGEGPEAA